VSYVAVPLGLFAAATAVAITLSLTGQSALAGGVALVSYAMGMVGHLVASELAARSSRGGEDDAEDETFAD